MPLSKPHAIPPRLTLLGAVRPQLIVLSIAIGLNVAARLGIMPPVGELIRILSTLLTTYGLPLVALTSFLENFAGVGTYFPGSVVLLAAMFATAGEPARAFLTYLCVLIPAVLANILSHQIGAHSSVGAAGAATPSRSLILWYATTYWHPQLAGLTAVASGAAGVSLEQHVRHFLPISLVWSIVWAVLLYKAGERLGGQVPPELGALFYGYLGLWLLWGFRQYYLRKRAESIL